jgi:uncharacterized protein
MSLYDSSVPAFVQILTSLKAILEKAEAHAAAKKFAPENLLSARLFPDMLPLTRQVQIACDHAAKACARLTGAEVPTFPDTETTFAELKARIAKALETVKSFRKEQFEGAGDRDITLPLGGEPMTLKGSRYLAHFALPNFYFHAVTAYDILRANGVEIGKRDFLGPR